MEREDEIRLIAYQIWEEEGSGHGRDCEHWIRAEVIWEQQRNPETAGENIKAEPRKALKRTPTTVKTKKPKV